jgi:hypothetical protein
MALKSKDRITRRHLVGLSALGVAAGIGTARAQQAPKITKAKKQLVGYVEKTPFATQSCVQCHFFIDPDDCEIVEGPVSPTGYCNYYAD